MNQYNVVKTQQIALDAESPEDAVTRALKGEGTTPGITINVQLRPQPATKASPISMVGAGPGVRPNA